MQNSPFNPTAFIYLKLWAAGGHATSAVVMNATATARPSHTHTHAHARARAIAITLHTRESVHGCMRMHTLVVSQANEVNQASIFQTPSSAETVGSACFCYYCMPSCFIILLPFCLLDIQLIFIYVSATLCQITHTSVSCNLLRLSIKQT